MHFPLSKAAVAIAGCIVANGCSNVPQQVVETVAEQAAKSATLEVELRDTKKSLADKSHQLAEVKSQLASSTESESRLEESLRLSNQAKQQALEENASLKAQLQETLQNLTVAASRLDQIEAAKRKAEADLKRQLELGRIAGVWFTHPEHYKNPEADFFEFRANGTGKKIFSGQKPLEFAWRETAELTPSRFLYQHS